MLTSPFSSALSQLKYFLNHPSPPSPTLASLMKTLMFSSKKGGRSWLLRSWNSCTSNSRL